jgi:hypothetical protein
VGLVLCAAAVAMLWALSGREFFAQFALAGSLAGQALVVGGLFRLYRTHDASIYLAIAGLEIALAALAPYSVHRTWSAFAAAMSVLLALHEWHSAFLFPGALALVFVMVQINEARLASSSAVWRPVAAGLALGLLAIVPVTLLLDSTFFFGQMHHPPARPEAWTGMLLMALVLVGSVAWLLIRNGIGLTSRVGLTALGASILLAAAGAPVSALLAAILIVVVAFASGHRAMTGLGVLMVLGSLAYYYYSLDATLLSKSVSLALAGVVLLAARHALRRAFGPVAAEGRHA